MQLPMVSVVAALLLAASSAVACDYGHANCDYLASCDTTSNMAYNSPNEIDGKPSVWLKAFCNQPNKPRAWTKINLTKCWKNIYGNLAAVNGGVGKAFTDGGCKFTGSFTDAGMGYTCPDQKGSVIAERHYKLNSVVGLDGDGVLVCGNSPGQHM